MILKPVKQVTTKKAMKKITISCQPSFFRSKWRSCDLLHWR